MKNKTEKNENENLSYVGLESCFFCGKEKGVILDRRLKKTLPHSAVYNYEPCADCEKYMKMGIIIIVAKDNSEEDNPHRTGGFLVVKEEYVKRIINNESLLKSVLERRFLFMHESTALHLGLIKNKTEKKRK